MKFSGMVTTPLELFDICGYAELHAYFTVVKLERPDDVARLLGVQHSQHFEAVRLDKDLTPEQIAKQLELLAENIRKAAKGYEDGQA